MRRSLRTVSRRKLAAAGAGILAAGVIAGGINVFVGSDVIPGGADSTPPTTSITTPPSDGTSTSASIPFTGADNVGVDHFECRIDSGSWSTCTSPKTYSGLSVASHTFDVRAYDAAGNFDATPATATWTITSGGGQTLNCSPAVANTMTNNVSHLCGFADVTNTGVPAGTTLKRVPQDITVPDATTGHGWHWAGTYLAVDTAGAVLQNVLVAENIDVTAANVTIQNIQNNATGNTWGISLRTATNVTIQDSTIGSPTQYGADRLQEGIRDIAGDSNGAQILRNNIYHIDSGINHFDTGGLIEGNYIHDMGFTGDDHINGIQLGSGNGPLMTIQDNTILNQEPQSDAIMLATDDGQETNRLVTHNLVAGGDYCVYGSGGPSDSPTYIRFTNNQFSRMFYSDCGFYGPAAYISDGTGNVWSGNIWDDTGATVPPR